MSHETAPHPMDVKKIAVIGAGSMGSMMACLFAEKGCQVVIEDPSEDARKLALENAEKTGFKDKITAAKSYDDLISKLDDPKVIVLSLPHGSVADSVLANLKPHLRRGDYIIDASNEYWERTQRRQGELVNMDCHFIGMGVSGGYQAARSGPSMSPGGEWASLERIMPVLEKFAAKAPDGSPCVARIGGGGAGHYTKMVHNGIEQGMMATLAEAWYMLVAAGLSYKEISEVFKQWDARGELSDNFLVSIGSDICSIKDPKDDQFVLSKVKDKVVQDVDGTEGTGIWTCEEGIRRHIPIPTITAGHQFRLGSSDAAHRERVFKAFGGHIAKPQSLKVERESFIERLRLAVYGAFLTAFVQGLTLLRKANKEENWGIDFESVIKIWRGGCIIRSGYISDLLAPLYKNKSQEDLLERSKIADELKKTYPAVKSIVIQAIEADLCVPSISASLEYLKYMTTKEDLPTQFMEAELDYFGKHMFDLRSDPAGKPVSGKQHFEWSPPKGLEGHHEVKKV